MASVLLEEGVVKWATPMLRSGGGGSSSRRPASAGGASSRRRHPQAPASASASASSSREQMLEQKLARGRALRRSSASTAVWGKRGAEMGGHHRDVESMGEELGELKREVLRLRGERGAARTRAGKAEADRSHAQRQLGRALAGDSPSVASDLKLLDGLRSRVTALSRQVAERDSLVEELRDHAKGRQTRQLGQHLAASQSEIVRLRATVADLGSARDDDEAAKRSAEGRLRQETRKQVARMRHDVARAMGARHHSNVAELERNVQRLQRELSAMRQRDWVAECSRLERMLHVAFEQQQVQRQATETDQARLGDLSAEMRDRVTKLQRQLADETAQREAAEQKLEAAGDSNARYGEQLSAATSKLKAVSARATQLEHAVDVAAREASARNAEMQESASALQQQLTAEAAQREAAEQKLEAAEDNISRLQSELETGQVATDKASASNETLAAQLQDVGRQLQQAESSQRSASASREASLMDVSVLTEERDEALRSSLQAQRDASDANAELSEWKRRALDLEAERAQAPPPAERRVDRFASGSESSDDGPGESHHAAATIIQRHARGLDARRSHASMVRARQQQEEAEVVQAEAVQAEAAQAEAAQAEAAQAEAAARVEREAEQQRVQDTLEKQQQKAALAIQAAQRGAAARRSSASLRQAKADASEDLDEISGNFSLGSTETTSTQFTQSVYDIEELMDESNEYTALGQSKARELFAHFDSDGDGFLSSEEVRHMGVVIDHETYAEDDLRAIMGAFESTDDGLTFQGFLELFKSDPTELNLPRALAKAGIK